MRVDEFTRHLDTQVDPTIQYAKDKIDSLIADEIYPTLEIVRHDMQDMRLNVAALRHGIEAQQVNANDMLALVKENMTNGNKLIEESTKLLAGIAKSNGELTDETKRTLIALQGTLNAYTGDTEALKTLLVTANDRLADPRITQAIGELAGMALEGHATLGNIETISERWAKPISPFKWLLDKLIPKPTLGIP